MGITSVHFKESLLSHPAAHTGAQASPHPDPIPTLPSGGEGTWPPCSPPALPLTVPPPGWRFAARPGWPCRPAAGTSRPGRTPAPAAGRSPAAAAAPPPWQRQMAAGGRPPLGSKSPGAVREMAPPAPRGAPGRPLGRQGRDPVPSTPVGFLRVLLAGSLGCSPHHSTAQTPAGEWGASELGACAGTRGIASLPAAAPEGA